jgi:hypothetical protein
MANKVICRSSGGIPHINRAGKLRDIGLQDRAPDANARECAEYGNGHDRNRDRRADRQPGAQAQVGIGSAKNDAEQDSKSDRLDREFGR